MGFHEIHMEAALPGIWTIWNVEHYVSRKSFRGKVHFQDMCLATDKLLIVLRSHSLWIMKNLAVGAHRWPIEVGTQ